MKVAVISLFPEMFSLVSEYGVTGRAVTRGLLQISTINPREYTHDRHRTVDDRPYGGGPGMVMLFEPVLAAITAARGQLPRARVIYLTPQGKPLQQADITRLSGEPALILLAGRYEGIDERIIDTAVDEEFSIGDYVLSGGELPAMVLIDALARAVPGVLGHEESACEDSFYAGLLDYPHYTRPDEIGGKRVPDVLLSGDHAAIARWRLKQALGRTWLRRPDLLQRLQLDPAQQALLEEFIDEHRPK